MNVVADACIAVKWYVRESGFEQAAMLLTARGDRVELCAPDIFFAETLNALAKKVRAGEAARQQAHDAFDHLARLNIEPVPTPTLAQRALELALRLDHAVQDCLYLACAEYRDAVLVTADDRFSRKLSKEVSTAQVVRLEQIEPFLASIEPTSA